MKLTVILPVEVIFHGEVRKVTVRGLEGPVTILPRHINYATALVPGILSYETVEGREKFIAVNEGLLVKTGSQVRVITHSAVQGADLGNVQQRMRKVFSIQDERERRARTALARLEADFVRRYLQLGEDQGG